MIIKYEIGGIGQGDLLEGIDFCCNNMMESIVKTQQMYMDANNVYLKPTNVVITFCPFCSDTIKREKYEYKTNIDEAG